jgi:hypothetical protein
MGASSDWRAAVCSADPKEHHMTKKSIGLTLIIASVMVWLIDRITQFFSTLIGEIYCGDRYMKPVEGIVGDFSCGFNADIYLTVSLFALFLIGILLFFSTKHRNL